MACIGNFADDRKIQFPFVENRLGKFFTAGLEHHEHALLAFGQHHFIRRHAFFAAWHLVHVEDDTRFAIGCHFNAGAGQTGGTHILNRDNGVRRHQFKTGFNQQFFREGVTHLNRRALLLNIRAEIGRCHRRTVNAVTACL